MTGNSWESFPGGKGPAGSGLLFNEGGPELHLESRDLLQLKRATFKRSRDCALRKLRDHLVQLAQFTGFQRG